ncbi:MAG: hypothetical protein ACO2PM_11830 [Pyrobaculum sp.]|jgi:hypothetical protein
MDTITAQWRIRLPQRPLESPEVGSERWSYDDAEEYVYGRLAEVEYKGAIKTASSFSSRSRPPRGAAIYPSRRRRLSCTSGRWDKWTMSRRRKSTTRCRGEYA